MSTLRVDNIQDQGGGERRGLKTYAIIADKKSGDSDGGSLTSGAWRTRDLNTEIADPDQIVSIASNQFTLVSGTYLIQWRAPAYRVQSHQTRLYNATSSAEVEKGTSEFANTVSDAQTLSEGVARVTITASTAFEIQHRVRTNSPADYGAGIGTSGGQNWGGGTIYTLVQIYKEA